MTSTAPVRDLAPPPVSTAATGATGATGAVAVPARARELWSSRAGFVLAASGAAVGLGNVWKFPYISGSNGGGAFVLVYLACIALVGLPILMAELLIGRRGGRNVVDSFVSLATREGQDARGWRLVGAASVLTALVTLSYHSVVGGWALAYVADGLAGRLAAGGDPARIPSLFTELLASPSRLLGWHTAFMLATTGIVAAGVTAGLERAARWMMPVLFVLLLALVGYAAAATGEFARAVEFLFRPDFSALTGDAVLEAVGHAFFTLGVGASGMLAYGSRLPRDVSIPRAATTVAVVDTVVALLAGVAIFPIVFAHGLAPAQGPGLVFVSFPVALANVPGGSLVSGAFFAFIVLTALTSAISLLEPGVELACDRLRLARRSAAALVGGAVWALGVAAALAFNRWAQVTVGERNVFDLLAFWTSSVFLPAGGVAFALFAGWVLSRRATADELGLGDGLAYRVWRVLVRWVAPAAVAVALFHGLRA